ncbi:ribosome biogenesis protein BRX1 homolog [Manacus candei]|uniref:ribosome biogenesis protein BRX1 homolog n=1 Tax=Manacus candei TaxID=415023 RepID=UPI002227E6AE|nr:ribosome biogenesis protein BRX1 homolog [Manacus candei]
MPGEEGRERGGTEGAAQEAGAEEVASAGRAGAACAAWGEMAAGKRKREALPAGKGKRARTGPSAAEAEAAPAGAPQEYSIPPPVSQGKWKNKERVLIFSSRGINFRTRHLMQDLRTLMPHSKADTKMDRKDQLFVINEVCEMKNCNKCIFFEAKKKQDLYMWLSNTPQGPSAKFLVQNVHTLAELKMTGNCLRGSRPLLSFDPIFDKEPHYALLKELFIQIFSTPQYHPKSQPFVDHVFTFTVTDERIWFRNYQIIEEDASLVEIGPRFVLNLIKIFQGSFGGPTLYENPHYQSPNMHRRLIRLSVAAKFREKQHVKEVQKEKKKASKVLVKEDPTEVVFETPAEEKPVEIQLVKPESKPIVKDKKKLRKIQRKKQKKLFRTEASA